jgi:hypothetical protein
MARREQAVRDALRALLREQHAALFGAAAPAVGTVSLQVRAAADPQAGWEVAFDPPLRRQVEESLVEAQAAGAALQPGRVYCFRCDGTACGHAAPPTPLAVFRGYEPNGTPAWSEFVQALLDARDERAGTLYATPPRVVAAVQLGHELRRRQLAVFGRASRRYAVLGQVTAGYFPLGRPGERAGVSADRIALTVQAVETRGPRGRTEVRLHALPGGLDAAQWQALLADDWCPWVGRSLRTAADDLARLTREIEARREAGRENASQPLGRIPVILQRLARGLEQGSRQEARRTRHAEARREERRPVHKALDDAAAAQAGDLLFDERRRTFVVRGRHGRAHVFAPDGKHVTSLVLPADGAAARVRTGRWRPMTAEEQAAWHSVTPGRTPRAASSGRPCPPT